MLDGGDHAQRRGAREAPAATPTAARLPARAATSAAPRTRSGIHAELLRRLEGAARYSPGERLLAGLPADAYRPGFDAGASPRLNTLRGTTTSMEATTLTEQLWGGETTKAVDNFPVSGERVPVPVVRWLGRLKAAAAAANGELGALDADVAERIAAAGEAVADGEHDDQFPIDVFQTGSGTSSNMNANEVIANLAGDGAHPNDHVNMGQSSNDVFPSAVHLAALGRGDATTCCRRWARCRRRWRRRRSSSPTSSRRAAPT